MPTVKQLEELESARNALKEIPRQAFSAFESLAEKDYMLVISTMQSIRIDAGWVQSLCREILKGGD